MIEVTVDTVDGVRFYKNVRILQPDEIQHGIGIHRVPIKRGVRDESLIQWIEALGLRKVGLDLAWRSDLYAQYPISFYRFKAVELGLKVYWAVIRWLYDNARLFKQIPEYQPFSWRYFTPYCWYRQIRNKR